MNKPADELILVFNADGGAVSRLMDAVHKIVRPETYECDLCMITHGALTQKREWTFFVESLDIPTRALHRDEFAREFPGAQIPWPAVLIRRAGGVPEVLVSREELAGLNGVPELAATIEAKLTRSETRISS